MNFFKEIHRLIYSASKQNKQPGATQSSVCRFLHSKNTPVPPLLREQDVPIFRHFKLSIPNYMDCNQFIQAFIFSLFHPLSCFFLFLDKAAGCIVSSQSLASLHVQTFFGNYKQPSQPREALSTSSQSVLIFTRLQNRSRCQP